MCLCGITSPDNSTLLLLFAVFHLYFSLYTQLTNNYCAQDWDDDNLDDDFSQRLKAELTKKQ